jgi:hypothetical protein
MAERGARLGLYQRPASGDAPRRVTVRVPKVREAEGPETVQFSQCLLSRSGRFRGGLTSTLRPSPRAVGGMAKRTTKIVPSRFMARPVIGADANLTVRSTGFT